MMPIEEVIKNTKRISLKDYVCFTCTGCGECCRQVKESVALEPLDVFKITQFLRTRDPSIRCIEDVLDRYTVPIFLTETGYMMFAMATEGEDHHCIFLRDSRCIIHEAKPRVCKLYPFVVGPADHGGLEYLLTTEKAHHFKGQRIRAKAWVKKYLTDEEREFIEADAASVVPIAKLLQDIPQKEQTIALLHFIRFKYSDFDLDQPFVPQYKRNMAKLEAVLQQMITNGGTSK